MKVCSLASSVRPSTSLVWLVALVIGSGGYGRSKNPSHHRYKQASSTKYCAYGKVYIGKSRHRLETCLKEHKDVCQRPHRQVSRSQMHMDHPICSEGTMILQHASWTMKLVVKEAICMWTAPESVHFNRDSGYYNIPDCWIATYKKDYRCPAHQTTL